MTFCLLLAADVDLRQFSEQLGAMIAASSFYQPMMGMAEISINS